MMSRRRCLVVAVALFPLLAASGSPLLLLYGENDRMLQGGEPTNSTPTPTSTIQNTPVRASAAPAASAPLTTSPPTGGGIPSNGSVTAVPSPVMGAGTTPSPSIATTDGDVPSVTPVSSTPSLAELIASNVDYGGFSTALVNSPTLTERLSSNSDVTTVFAADNEAFRNMDPVLTAKLQTDQYAFHYTSLIDYHALDGAFLTTNLSDGTSLTMLNNETLRVGVDNATKELILHNPYNASLVGRMVLKDVPASNGFVTGISGDSGPLMPDFVFLDVPAKIASVKSLSNFTAWIVSSGLDLSLLRQEGVTVLVPGNQAFAKAESPFLDYYGDPDNAEELRALLMYHAIPSMLPTTMFTTESVPTLLANRIGVEVDDTDGRIVFNDKTTIVSPNFLAWNGIVHEIDSFLTPPETAFPSPQPKVGDPTMPTGPMAAPSPPSVPTAAGPTETSQSPALPTAPGGAGSGSDENGTSSGHYFAASALSIVAAAILPMIAIYS
jgi:uncharacterized surface protein with fasciclin (FAS1) repeats